MGIVLQPQGHFSQQPHGRQIPLLRCGKQGVPGLIVLLEIEIDPAGLVAVLVGFRHKAQRRLQIFITDPGQIVCLIALIDPQIHGVIPAGKCSSLIEILPRAVPVALRQEGCPEKKIQLRCLLLCQQLPAGIDHLIILLHAVVRGRAIKENVPHGFRHLFISSRQRTVKGRYSLLVAGLPHQCDAQPAI